MDNTVKAHTGDIGMNELTFRGLKSIRPCCVWLDKEHRIGEDHRKLLAGELHCYDCQPTLVWCPTGYLSRICIAGKWLDAQ